jgi:hypothetical protein
MFLQSSLNLPYTTPGDTGDISQAAQTAIDNAVIQVSGIVHPWIYVIWALGILAILGLWYYFTKKPYVPRRFRRLHGKGNLRDLLDNFM